MDDDCRKLTKACRAFLDVWKTAGASALREGEIDAFRGALSGFPGVCGVPLADLNGRLPFVRLWAEACHFLVAVCLYADDASAPMTEAIQDFVGCLHRAEAEVGRG